MHAFKFLAIFIHLYVHITEIDILVKKIKKNKKIICICISEFRMEEIKVIKNPG